MAASPSLVRRCMQEPPCYHTASKPLQQKMLDPAVTSELERIVGPGGILRDAGEMLTYESDGLARLHVTPGCVVLPASAAEVQQIGRLCHQRHVPVVAPGHGTRLSGGPLAP